MQFVELALNIVQLTTVSLIRFDWKTSCTKLAPAYTAPVSRNVVALNAEYQQVNRIRDCTTKGFMVKHFRSSLNKYTSRLQIMYKLFPFVTDRHFMQPAWGIHSYITAYYSIGSIAPLSLDISYLPTGIRYSLLTFFKMYIKNHAYTALI